MTASHIITSSHGLVELLLMGSVELLLMGLVDLLAMFIIYHRFFYNLIKLISSYNSFLVFFLPFSFVKHILHSFAIITKSSNL